MRRLTILLICAAAVASGCSSGRSASSASTTTATSSARTLLGYTRVDRGAVTVLTRETPTTTATNGATSMPASGIGDAMTTTRLAKPVAARPGSAPRSVEITFACVTNRNDVIDSIAYRMGDRTLVVSAQISGTSGGQPCLNGEGATIELPLREPWVAGTTVEAGELG